MWDTAGLERAGRMTNNYYKQSHAIVFMYDIGDLATFSRLRVWFDEASLYAPPNKTKYFIVGNKSDISAGEVEVRTGQVKAWASDILNIPKEHLFRVSVKDGTKFDTMIQTIARILTETVKPVTRDERVDRFGIDLDDTDGGGRSGCCS